MYFIFLFGYNVRLHHSAAKGIARFNSRPRSTGLKTILKAPAISLLPCTTWVGSSMRYNHWRLRISYILADSPGSCRSTLGQRLLLWSFQHACHRAEISGARIPAQKRHQLRTPYSSLTVIFLWRFFRAGCGSKSSLILPPHM